MDNKEQVFYMFDHNENEEFWWNFRDTIVWMSQKEIGKYSTEVLKKYFSNVK